MRLIGSLRAWPSDMPFSELDNPEIRRDKKTTQACRCSLSAFPEKANPCLRVSLLFP
jgi:hypothetical protein